MTLTQAERDWLAALWRQAERDADLERTAPFSPFNVDAPPLKPKPTWPNPPRLSWNGD